MEVTATEDDQAALFSAYGCYIFLSVPGCKLIITSVPTLEYPMAISSWFLLAQAFHEQFVFKTMYLRLRSQSAESDCL